MKKLTLSAIALLTTMSCSVAVAQSLEEKYPDLTYDQAHAYELYLQSYADSDNKLDEAKIYTNQQVNKAKHELYKYVDDQNSKVKAGIASVVAMSNIPYMTDKTVSVGIGTGFFKGENAGALGVRVKATEWANFQVSAGYDSQHDTTVGAGLAFGF